MNKHIKEVTFKIKKNKRLNIDFLDVIRFGKKHPNHSLEFSEKIEKFITLKCNFETKTNVKKALEDIKEQLKTSEKTDDVEIFKIIM